MAVNKSIRVAALGLLLSGCLSDLNLNPDTDFVYQGHWAVPIVNTRINLGNLVANDSNAYADPDGLVHILYRQDSVYSQNVYDYTAVPEQAPTEADVVVGMPDVSVITNLGTFGGAKLKTMEIATGKLHWEMDCPVPGPVSVQLELLYTDINGVPAIFTLTSNGQGVTTGNFDVSGLEVDLTQGNPAYNNLGFKLSMVNSAGAPNGTNIKVKLRYEDLAVEAATGYFGQRKINFPSGLFQTNLSVLDNLAAGLYLANPKVKLFVKSNLGLPVEIAPDMLGISAGTSIDLGLAPITISAAPSQGVTVYDTIVIDKNNSQIDQFISLVPKEIMYSGNATLNPAGEPTTDNFVTRDGRVDVGVEIDLPLELSTQDLIIEQTIYNIDFGVEDGNTDFVENLQLGFRATNAFPLDADVTVYFQDISGAILDSAFVEIFDAAPVDANGRVNGTSKGDRFLNFTREQIKTILKSDDIRIRIVLNTTGGGNQVVRLYTENYIDMIVGAKVKLNYNL